MASIGPQIPSHLQKRDQPSTSHNDSQEEDEPGPSIGPTVGPAIPAHLLQSRVGTGRDENSAKQESTSSIGPQIPAHLLGPSIGPQVPNALRSTTPPSVPPTYPEEDEEDEDAYAPALPPSLITSRADASSSSKAKTQASSSNKRVIGPTFPGQVQNRGYEEDDSEDEYGPSVGPMPPPPSVGGGAREDRLSEGVREFMEREERRRKEAEESAKPKAPQRESWMLVPPTHAETFLAALSDPTKLKARQFNRTSNSSSAKGGPSDLWTETPAERQKRVADEVAGRKRRAIDIDAGREAGVGESGADGAVAKRRRDEEVRKAIEEHNRSSRGETLLDMHKKSSKSKSKDKEKDDGPPVIWDHTRDMSVGGRLMDEKSRNKLISDARGLGERFGSGKSGGYL